MTDPIDTLMEEHRVIEKVLAALEEAADKEMEPRFYEQALEFLARFADGCHHAKEEDRLFPVLEERGIPRDMGPIGVMCHEHVVGREHIRRMRECLASGDRAGLRRESLEYAALLRAHIAKEDDVLFQMARDVLRAEDVAKLERDFEAAQAGPVCDVRYKRLADELRAEAGRA